MPDSGEHPLILFDGVCNLCNASVNYVIDRDPAALFRFASLQSDTAEKRLGALGVVLPKGDPDSILLIEDGRVYRESTAALRIARLLKGPARWWAVFQIVPRPIRDAVYQFIARHRYRWFGRTDACRVPTPELASRFL
jgi:predicted DCC family thiol-disulfide oxidoreductase YuxK